MTSRSSSRASRCAHFAGVGQLRLTHGDHFRFAGQGGTVHLQLAADGLIVGNRIAAVAGKRLDQMDEHTGTLDVAQELVAQADAAVCPLDEARQIGQDENPFAAESDQTEVGVLGRERIVGDFRLRMAEAAEEGRFAGVGQTDEAGVGDDLQFQDEPASSPTSPGCDWRGRG